MTGQKIHCVHPPAAFALQFKDPQSVLAASDDNAILAR